NPSTPQACDHSNFTYAGLGPVIPRKRLDEWRFHPKKPGISSSRQIETAIPDPHPNHSQNLSISGAQLLLNKPNTTPKTEEKGKNNPNKKWLPGQTR
ncbi:MAG TPA: hypothetical protein VIK88_01555, partial [Candidatus Bathyarchaeia archaeon]